MTGIRLTITGGRDKDGRPEPVTSVTLAAGDVLAIVGPTGSGKTRLLADIERLARGDSPSGRVIAIEGVAPSRPGSSPVARISQSMSFFLDATVAAFLAMHARFLGAAEGDALVDEVIAQANALCGEPFGPSTLLAHLSGGQARSLMVADTVLVSAKPVVLIDEIENAGIDRRLALSFLLRSDVIAVLATHDPLLALRAPRRLVLARGGMQSLIERRKEDDAVISVLEKYQDEIERVQRAIREGREPQG